MPNIITSSPVDSFMQSANTGEMKAAIDLGNINNTSDADKPVSTLQQTALNTKGNLTGGNIWTGPQTFSDALTFNGSSYTYGVGAAATHRAALSLDNVNNTSDTSKPISTLQQAALDLKVTADIYNIFCHDDFLGTGPGSGTIGDFGWGTGGGATYTLRGSEDDHPGIIRIARAATGNGYLHLNYGTSAFPAFNNKQITTVIRLGALTGMTINFGIMSFNGTFASSGRKCLIFDPAISANWLLVHQSSGGGPFNQTDTGIAATLGWQILTLSFAGATTTGTVKTLAGTGSVTNSNATTEVVADHAPGITMTVSAGTSYIDVDVFELKSNVPVTRL